MLSEKQERFLRADLKRINLLYGSVRSGKTWVSLLRWALFVGMSKEDAEFLMVGKTLTTLKRNCLGLLADLIGDNIDFSLSKKEARIFGRRVWLEGANDERSEAKIRGLTLSGAYIDELTQIPKDFYMMTLSRLSAPNALLIATTNPDSPNHFVKTDIIDNDDIDKAVYKFLLDDNIFLDEEYKNNIKREYLSMSQYYYDKFILGNFVRAEGVIFPILAEPEKFMLDKIPNVRPVRVECGFDIGGNQSAYAITCTMRGADGVYYVLASRKKQAENLAMIDIERFVDGFCRDVSRKNGLFIERVNSDHVDAIINSINDNTSQKVYKAYKPPLEDRVFIVNKLLLSGKLKFISNECDDLLDELQNLVYDEKTDKAIPLDDGTMQIDTWDSFIYSISGDWDYITKLIK